MIEVDGLMAAVIPTPNASPSADAPAEFAAAMALVEGETGQSGQEPAVEQQLTLELIDTEIPVDTEMPVDAESPMDADPVVDGDPIPGLPSPDGREIGLTPLAVIAPAPAVVLSAPVLRSAPPGDAAEVSTEVSADAAPPAVTEVDTPVAPITVDPTISDATVATPAAADAPVAESVPAAASVAVADDALPAAADAAEAAVPRPVVESAPGTDAPATIAAITPTVSEVATDEPTPDVEVGGSTPSASAPPDPAPTAGATTAPTPSTGSDRTEIATPDVSVEGIEAQTSRSTADVPGAVVDAATTTRTPDSVPTVDAPTPSIQPAAVSAPTPRADANVAEVVDVPPTPSTPTPEASPTQQVAEALREVRRLADGSHRLSLQLHPEELGAVQLEVAIRDGQLHVRAVAETEAARSALEQNLPELRSDLRDAGVRAGSLEVGPDVSGRDRPDSPTRESRAEERGESGAEGHPTTTPDPSTSSGLDIRL